MIKISASTNPCPEQRLYIYAQELQRVGVEFIHVDVMDGEFVNSKCFNSSLIYEIKKHSILPLDCHLMVENPMTVIKEYGPYKLNYITVHYESFDNNDQIEKCFKLIRSYNSLVGLSIKPTTSVDTIESLLPLVDLVLIMGVEPGASGQTMLSNTHRKVKQLKDIITKNNYNIKIEVDGGVNLTTIDKIAKAGADMVVAGSCLFEAKDRKDVVDTIHNAK